MVKCLNDAHGTNWAAYHGDTVSVMAQLPDASVDFSVYSPPFADLFTYSDSEADMGNNSGDEQFFEHYRFAVEQIYRLTKPGRLTSVHCKDLPSFKFRHGAVGLRDFPGDVIRAHTDFGWIYHSRVTVWKDPVTEMQRTKALGLLHKQIIKDSSMSRMGLPDYVLTFRKPGENAEFVAHDRESFPVDQWQEWASPVWMDIRQGEVLDKVQARAPQDEKHIVPLQLDLIRRCLVLWSNPGDTVLSPFMGIGSEGYCSLKHGRKYIGIELKDSYFKQACRYLAGVEAQPDLLAAE